MSPLIGDAGVRGEDHPTLPGTMELFHQHRGSSGSSSESDRAVAAPLRPPRSPALQPGLQAQAPRQPQAPALAACCLHGPTAHSRPSGDSPESHWSGEHPWGFLGTLEVRVEGVKQEPDPPALAETSALRSLEGQGSEPAPHRSPRGGTGALGGLTLVPQVPGGAGVQLTGLNVSWKMVPEGLSAPQRGPC